MGKKLSIVGGGKMGEALLSGLLAAEWAPADEISVVEPDDSRRNELQKKYKETPLSENLVPSDNYLLAVKPQLVPNICQELSNSDPLRVMSIAAGVTITSIESQLTSQTAVLRIMPNTPSMVREGMSAIAPGSFATSEDLDWASSILSAVGEVVIVDESTLDAVTGLSGSGPAYLFLLAEAMTHSSASSARKLNNERLEFLVDTILNSVISMFTKIQIARYVLVLIFIFFLKSFFLLFSIIFTKS